MPNSSTDPQQQFHAVENLLTDWLKERRALLTAYTALIVSLDSQPSPAALDSRQQDLCALLVDYISAGHFEIFHQLVDEAEAFHDGSESLAIELIPDIADTTEVILAYEEKHGSNTGQAKNLRRDLSSLGEILEARFVLEDQLIAGLHNSHRRQITAPAQPA